MGSGFLPELRGAREWQYQVRGSVDRIHSVVHGPGLNEADLLLEEEKKKSSSPVFLKSFYYFFFTFTIDI